MANTENDHEMLLNVEDIILDRLVPLHTSVNTSISYQKLKDSAGAITSEIFDTSLEDLVAQVSNSISRWRKLPYYRIWNKYSA